MNEPKKLYRVEAGAKLAGVCGGIAEFFNIDPNILRLIWAVFTVCSVGTGLLVYVLAAAILPKKSDVYPGY